MTDEKLAQLELAERLIDELELVSRGEFVRLGLGSIIETDIFFADQGWLQASCAIAGRSGKRARRFRRFGYSHKGLFIHCEPASDEWVVTHFATGYKIKGFAGKAAARAALTFGEAIAELIDWEGITSIEAWENMRSPRLSAAIRHAAVVSAETAWNGPYSTWP